MPFKIFPPIGIARVGNSSDSFFVGPEFPGHPGMEIGNDGAETKVENYKTDSTHIKRQGARFRIFEFDDEGANPRPVALGEGDRIQWSVTLANKKSAVRRGGAPRSSPSRPVVVDADAIIQPTTRNVSGANSPIKQFSDGDYLNRSVPLGDIRTDGDQNLIVLGGFGFSSSPDNRPIVSFYRNPGWHDDTSDGRVSARIIRSNGDVIEDIESAWCIVSTPDYAASIDGIVTLYDILTQVAVDHHELELPERPSFTKDIFPILLRTSQLRFVNSMPDYEDLSTDWAALADETDAAEDLRNEAFELVNDGASFLSRFQITNSQVDYLEKWVSGEFDSDWRGVPATQGAITPDGLTRAALNATVGQGFFPGIEAGIIVKDPTLYRVPFEFRFDINTIEPGDVTALMAVPWQADFYDCRRSWWPAQRPDNVIVDEVTNRRSDWDRGISNKRELVDKFSGMGFVVPIEQGEFPKMVEKQRAESEFFE